MFVFFAQNPHQFPSLLSVYFKLYVWFSSSSMFFSTSLFWDSFELYATDKYFCVYFCWLNQCHATITFGYFKLKSISEDCLSFYSLHLKDPVDKWTNKAKRIPASRWDRSNSRTYDVDKSFCTSKNRHTPYRFSQLRATIKHNRRIRWMIIH